MGNNDNIYKIKVPDMSCKHCEMRIKNALNELPGVLSVSVDLNSKEVEVKASAGLTREMIIDRIKEEGYRPD
jgi:copper chaperone CopZ